MTFWFSGIVILASLIQFVGFNHKHLSHYRHLAVFACKALYFGIAKNSLSSTKLFWNIGEIGARKSFADNQRANTIQLFVAIRGNASCQLFVWNTISHKISGTNSKIEPWLLKATIQNPITSSWTVTFLT